MTAVKARSRRVRLAALLLAASALTACASTQEQAATAPGEPSQEELKKQAIAQLNQMPVPDDPIGRAAYYAQRAEVEPENVDVAIAFVKALRGIGSVERAVEFLEERLMMMPNEPRLLAEYGKTLVGVGRLQEGIQVLAQAQALAPQDWTIPMAMGVAYDQLGDHTKARQYYEVALQISPNNPSILNNIGLSYMVAGDKVSAAKYLRMAAAAPGADERVRANLAKVNDVPASTADSAPDKMRSLPKQTAEAAPVEAPPVETPPPPAEEPAASEQVPANEAAVPKAAEPMATGKPRAMVTAPATLVGDLRGSRGAVD